jgi:hypothetical protein
MTLVGDFRARGFAVCALETAFGVGATAPVDALRPRGFAACLGPARWVGVTLLAGVVRRRYGIPDFATRLGVVSAGILA